MSTSQEERNQKDYLNDILDILKDISLLTEGLSFEDFKNDKKTFYAVSWCFVILGQAVKKIPQETQAEYPDISWQQLAGRGVQLIRDHPQQDMQDLWETSFGRLTPLKEAVKKMMVQDAASQILDDLF